MFLDAKLCSNIVVCVVVLVGGFCAFKLIRLRMVF